MGRPTRADCSTQGMMNEIAFDGYARANGHAGVRNHLLVLSVAGLTGPAARRVAQALPGTKLVSMPYGGGRRRGEEGGGEGCSECDGGGRGTGNGPQWLRWVRWWQ